MQPEPLLDLLKRGLHFPNLLIFSEAAWIFLRPLIILQVPRDIISHLFWEGDSRIPVSEAVEVVAVVEDVFLEQVQVVHLSPKQDVLAGILMLHPPRAGALFSCGFVGLRFFAIRETLLNAYVLQDQHVLLCLLHQVHSLLQPSDSCCTQMGCGFVKELHDHWV